MKKTNRERAKTRYVAFVASSVDGVISLEKKVLPDWTSKEDWDFLQGSLAGMGAVVVGRNTYEAAAVRLRKRNTYVFSRRTKGMARRSGVTFVNPLYTDISKLLAQYNDVAILGGDTIYGIMLELGLLTDIFVTIEPYVFGKGTRMFTGVSRATQLKLLSIKKLNNTGTLLAHYKVIY